MSYRPLTLDPKTPRRVKQLVQSVEDHFFRDVHTMLRLPEPDHQLIAGCNFAITQVLAAAVSGISVTLYSHTGGGGEAVQGLVEGFLPMVPRARKRCDAPGWSGRDLFAYSQSTHP